MWQTKQKSFIMQRIIIVITFLFSLTVSNAQNIRYLNPVFASSTKTANVIYANAPSITTVYVSESFTSNINLKMDIFQPTGDTLTKRPLIMMIHSGAFINGTKDNQDMQALCDSFARRGYVTCSIDYRLNFNPFSSSSAERAVYRGLQDAAAAIRFLKAQRLTYKIDTNYIFPWGSSAGGFTALNLAYLNDSERPASTFTSPDLKCINCVGNTYPHTCKVQAIVNCWGAVGNTNWINASNNNVPAILFHGDQDGTVPYNVGNPFGLSTLPTTYGSFSINQRLNAQNIYHEFYTGVGKGHEYWGTSNGTFNGITTDYQDIINKTAIFLYRYLPTTPTLKAKVTLSNMNGDLVNLPNFPLSDPYASSPFNTAFTHFNNPIVSTTTPIVLANATGNNAIVDWVFLELRNGTSGATSVAYTKSALLQADGDIVDADGVSPVKFNSVPSGAYYIALRHRNHLGFRTANKYTLSAIATNLDFSNNSIPLFGATPLNSSNYMNGGDANSDGSIDAFDTIVWELQNGLFDDYTKNADYNMDGSIDAFDTIIWELNNGKFQELD